ncbi:ankyrin repeat, SAM and basic leucine zipper domain-containing protein 1-like [Dendronephthya gigantea]|uniref:ankyrin repeat, SAM and basic leucine zipper domain-containing protein 1-like n=1 Tax=Dendronephthya gigantea TaxID=151771 RepID=UPI00106CD4A5|nr:ankyrin repeat, SAM and basic leucine zipper domain-containing protein 1-like [Dendronephthya gigantea]
MSQKLNEVEKEWLFSFACSPECHIQNVKDLLKKNPNLATMKTALHWAARNGSIAQVDFLLANGVDPEIQTNGGYTALHLATMFNHNDVVLLLLDDYRACVDARDNSGKRPKDYLKRNAMPSVKNKLQGLDSCPRESSEKPMTNISNMFLQMCSVNSLKEDVCTEERNVFMSPFFLPNPEIKTIKLKSPTTRRSRVNTTFRKVRPKLKKTTKVAVDDEENLEAKKRIGSPVPMRNNFLDFSGVPRQERARSEPDVGRLLEQMQTSMDER